MPKKPKIIFEETAPYNLPIYNSSTYCFKSVGHAARIFGGKAEGDVYMRLSHPNARLLEKSLAELEGGKAAKVFTSGMAAIDCVVRSLIPPKTKSYFITGQVLYGGTDELFRKDWGQLFGVEVLFVDTIEPLCVEDKIKRGDFAGYGKPVGIFLETPANPTLDISDIRAISKIAKKYEIPLVVDNTFATPYNQRPLELGADIIIHSLTKYLGGHGDLIGGAVIGSKKFIEEKLSPIRKNKGTILAPDYCFLVQRGLKTLDLRMRAHNENANFLARLLENHPEVEKIYYPGLKSHPNHEVAARQMVTKKGGNGYGGMISFEIAGSVKRTKAFLNFLAKSCRSCFKLAVSLGSTYCLVEAPALMTHVGVPKEEREKCGITDKLIRMSIGINDFEEIKTSINAAFKHIRKIK